MISQPGLTAEDLHDSNEIAHLRMRSQDSGYAGQMQVSGVLGEVDAFKMAEEIAKACGAPWADGDKADGNMRYEYKSAAKDVKFVQYAALPTARRERRAALSKLGKFLVVNSTSDTSSADKNIDERLDAALPKPKDDHVLIFFSAPAERYEHHDQLYEMDEPYPTAMHQDLKRDLNVQARASSNNSMQDGLPLFEKYQFLTPGKHLPLDDYVVRIADKKCRSLHDADRQPAPACHPLGWRFCNRRSRGLLRRFQQGDGPAGAEQGQATVRSSQLICSDAQAWDGSVSLVRLEYGA